MKQISLTQGQFTIVDDEDFEELNKFKWYAIQGRSTFYAVRTLLRPQGPKRLWLHRVILKLTIPAILVDHKDHNGLNNQKTNLRKALTSQNAANRRGLNSNNTSGFCGVMRYWLNSKPTWIAKIRVEGKLIQLGFFNSPIEAAIAYNKAAIEKLGPFASINNID